MRTVRTIPWTSGSKIAEELLRLRLLALAHLFRGRILDLGCGGKPYALMLGSRVERWIGLDRRAVVAGATAADVFGSALAVPFLTKSFDVVLCTQVLEHVPFPQTLFAEVKRVLKPGGHVIVSAPQTNPLHEEPDDYFRFTCHGLRMLVETAGLQVDSLMPSGGAVATIAQMMIWHAGFVRRLPLAGPALAATLNATLAWTAIQLDRRPALQRGGASKDVLNWVVVARSGE